MNNFSHIRLGILGCGKHVRNIMLPAIAYCKSIRVCAIGSRSPKEFKSPLGDDIFVGNYRQVIEDSALDAIYIATPNDSHATLSREAIEAGKHVLCEKPLADNETDACDLFEAAKVRGLILTEALMPRYHSFTRQAQSIADKHFSGPPKNVVIRFRYELHELDNIRLQRSRSGGIIRDVMPYMLDAACMWANAPVDSITATATTRADTGVDATCTCTLRFENGSIASLYCSNQEPREQRIEASWDTGSLIVHNPFIRGRNEVPFVVLHKRGDSPIKLSGTPENQYLNMLEAFSETVRTRSVSSEHCAASLRNARLLEHILKTQHSPEFEETE